MRYALTLAFGAAVLAQSAPSCVDLVTETVTQTFYSCACPATTGLPTSLSTSTTTATTDAAATTTSVTATISGTIGGPGESQGPILTSSEGTTTTTTTTVVPTIGTTATVSDGTTVIITTTVAPTTAPTTTTTTTTAAAPTGNGQVRQVSLSTFPSGPAGYIERALFAHNIHRTNHSIPALLWDAQLAQIAQDTADTCVYQHNTTAGGGGYGQNIGAGFTADRIPVMITNAMYNGEINFYPGPYGADNVDFSNFGAWGHYSQLVWRSTTAVGCATRFCESGLAQTGPGVPPHFTVCNYRPAGNFVGQFSQVATPGGGETIVFVD